MWAEKAKAMGFQEVAAGPLIRSSYKAEELANRPESKSKENEIWTEKDSSSNCSDGVYKYVNK
jgi:hypothetical protein